MKKKQKLQSIYFKTINVRVSVNVDSTWSNGLWAQWAKWLLCKHKGLHTDFRHPHKNPDMTVCICKPDLAKVVVPGDSTVGKSSNQWVLGLVGDCLKVQCEKQMRKTPDGDLWPPWVHTWLCTHTFLHSTHKNV